MTTVTTQNRKEYETKLAAKLGEWGEKIDELSKKAETTKGEAREKLDEEITNLQQKRMQANQKLDELSRASDVAWGDLTSGLDRAAEEMRLAIERARVRFDSKGGA